MIDSLIKLMVYVTSLKDTHKKKIARDFSAPQALTKLLAETPS